MAILKTKRSTVAGVIPAASSLVLGELALNSEDGYLYAEKLDGTTVQRIGTTADRVEYIPAGTVAVPMTVQSKLRESLSVQSFGAVGNGIANDTAAFSKLETDHPGVQIDLLGKIYVVDAIPSMARYYNGDFIVGSSRVSLRRNKLDNPLDGNSWLAFGDGQIHYWLFGFVCIESSGKLLAFVKPGYRHATSPSTPLNVIESDDRGLTWKNERTVHSVAGFDISHAACTIMSGGRIGAVAYLNNETTTTTRNDFVYSDDGGVTWSASSDIISGSTSVFTYGDVMPYPAAAGGADSTGFAVYGYKTSAVRVITTVNNGVSWATTTVSNLSTFAEPSVVRVNNENKWLMFLRSADATNLYVSTSTNMTTWNTPVDTGYVLGSNPVYAFVDGGRLFVYCFFRDYAIATGGLENQLICFEESPTAVYGVSNLVNKAPRAVSDGADRNVGYLCIRKVGQDYVWGYITDESEGSTNNASTSSIVFGSTRRVPSVGLGYLKSSVSHPNLLRNPTFQFWSRGTSFPGINTSTKIADGWVYNASGATATVSRIALTESESMLFPFRPQYALSLVTSVSDDYAGIYQRFFSKEELFRFSEQSVAIQVWGIGDIPRTASPYLPRVIVTFDYGAGGSATVSVPEFLSFTESGGNAWVATAYVDAPTVIGKTIGADPDVRIQFDSQANGAWNAKIVGIKAEFGKVPSRFDPVDYHKDRMLCDRYVQRIDLSGISAISNVAAQSAALAFGVMSFPEMRVKPSISLVNGIVSDFEIYPSGAALSALSWSNIANRAAMLNATTSGLTSGNAYAIRSKTGTTPSILLDAE